MEVRYGKFSLFLEVDLVLGGFWVWVVLDETIARLFLPDGILGTVGKFGDALDVGIILNTNKNTVLLGGL